MKRVFAIILIVVCLLTVCCSLCGCDKHGECEECGQNEKLNEFVISSDNFSKTYWLCDDCYRWYKLLYS